MVTIVDQRGQPIRTQQLKVPQTSSVASLHQEFAGHPVRGLTPAKLSGILEQAEQGDIIAQCDLFEDIEEKDGHLLAELGKRKRAVLGVNWVIEPPRNATPEEEKLAAYAGGGGRGGAGRGGRGRGRRGAGRRPGAAGE